MDNKKFARLIYSYLKPHRAKYLCILLAMLYTGVHISLEPYLLKLIITKVTNFGDDRGLIFVSLLPLILLFIFASLFNSMCWQTKHFLERAIVPVIETNMAMHIFQYLQMHSHRFFQDQLAGSLSNKIADLHAGIDRILGILTHFFRMFVGIFITCFLMYLVHPVFTLFVFSWTVIFLSVSILFMKKIEIYSITRADTRSHAFGRIVDSLSNMMTIRLFGRYDFELKMQEQVFERYIKDDQKLRLQQIFTWFFLGGFATFLLGGMITLLVYSAQRGWIIMADFAFIMMTSARLIESMFFLMELINEFTRRWGSAKQGAMLIESPHEIIDSVDAKDLKLERGTIEFKNASFTYAKEPFLYDLSVKVFGGQKVGLVGYSGGGKTTFINLICRIYDIQEGEILIDEQNIKDVTQKSLRDAISYIPQDPILFHRTIRENIKYGNLNATEDDVIHAAKMAHAHEFIMRMPLQYDTIVGERGLKLSGGQRQRIAIARSYIKNAPILIMDEATAALDTKTEQLIQESVEKLMVGKTVFVIAHRLSTLLSMDRIIVFNKGRIVEDGDHYTLLEKNGLYKELWKGQTSGIIGTKKRTSR